MGTSRLIRQAWQEDAGVVNYGGGVGRFQKRTNETMPLLPDPNWRCRQVLPKLQCVHLSALCQVVS